MYIYIYIHTYVYVYIYIYTTYNLPPPNKNPPNKKSPPPSKSIAPTSKLIVTIFAPRGGVLMRGEIVPPSKLIIKTNSLMFF